MHDLDLLCRNDAVQLVDIVGIVGGRQQVPGVEVGELEMLAARIGADEVERLRSRPQ